ncbi:MAG TPA: vanomycin resistance protein VanB, partial [Chloroflexia bacterium]
VYGYPISEEISEVSPTNGETYLVQYFERNRFEYHPEAAGTPFEVQLGLLGANMLKLDLWWR